MSPNKKNSPPPFSWQDDCERPSCDDIMSKFKAARDRSHQKQQQSNSSKHENPTTSTVSVDSDDTPPLQCPPNSQILGQSTWTLLHTMAAWYPDQPTQQEQTSMTNFVQGLAQFYPCTWCAKDFQQNLQEQPVQYVSNQKMLVISNVLKNQRVTQWPQSRLGLSHSLSLFVSFLCFVSLHFTSLFNAIRTSSRKELCQWFCMQHNLVNEKLGKPLFSCEMNDLDRRWRKNPACSKK